MKYKTWFIVILILYVFNLSAQNGTIRISGYVFDAQSKETLIGASVYEPEYKKGTVTNAYGFYSFAVTTGKKQLEVSFVGYTKQVLDVDFYSDTVVNIYLKPSTTLNEVVIVDKAYEKRFTHQEIPGKVEINPQIIMKMPTLTGESDLLKAVQMFAGVKNGTEGTTGLYVRGGNIDQNLYLIDGIEVYNPNHLMGFISTFNTDAIKSINFYKGGFPSEFTGRASSVMDIRMKDGNNEKINGDVSVGLISAKLNLEGPIVKDKTTFSFSARRTYLDVVMRPIIGYINSQSESQKTDFSYHFYDINAKVKHRFNTKNSLTVSFYSGQDKYGLGIDDKDLQLSKSESFVRWRNTIATIDYARQFSSQLFSNLSFSYNQYTSVISSYYESKDDYYTKDTYRSDFDYNSGVKDFTLKNNYNYYLNDKNVLNFGAFYTHHKYTPQIITAVSNSSGNQIIEPFSSGDVKYANEIILYTEDVLTVNEKFSARGGLNFDYYNVEGVSYKYIQPRISLRYALADNLSFKGGFASMNQNIHLLANGLFSLPTDLWVPVTKQIKPIHSHQLSAGVFYRWLYGINLSLEGYYKILNNVIDYKDGISTFNSAENWEQKVAQGKGKAYGMEINLQRDKGKVTGWIAYTLSWAKRLYESGEINAGQEFYDRFDVRHQLNCVVSSTLNDNWEITGAFVINSGSRTNIPIANYYFPMDLNDNQYGYQSSYLVSIYGNRNNFKLPYYCRLDLGVSYRKQKKHGESVWSFNVYNALNHKNAFMVFTSNRPNVLSAISVMPIIPTLSYSYKF